MSKVSLEVLEHPKVELARGYSTRNVFDNTEVKCFWANSLEAGPDDKFIHWGNKIAQEWREAENAKRPSVASVMKDHEGHRGVLSLDELEKTEKDPRVVSAICAIASYSYAMSATDRVMVSVKGAAPSSYFREVEFPVILANDMVKKIVIASRDNPKGQEFSKAEAYHYLRDDWLESTTKKFESAKARAAEKPEAYIEACAQMAKEVVLAEKTKGKTMPFSRGNSIQIAEDLRREESRLQKCSEILGFNPDLAPFIERERQNKEKSFAQHVILEHVAIEKMSTLAKEGQKAKESAELIAKRIVENYRKRKAEKASVSLGATDMPTCTKTTDPKGVGI